MLDLKGITKDYFWFEGSFHYHLFILKPILELFIIAKEYHYIYKALTCQVLVNAIYHAHPDKLNIEIKYGSHFLTVYF